MIRALFSAATGMQSQQIRVDNVANNIANVNTTGFKRGRADFQDLLYQTLQSAGAETNLGTTTPVGIQLGHGVRPSAVSKSFTQGSLLMTERPLDIAIQGKGFFQIQGPDNETFYSRDGAFKLDDTGQMVTADGFPLEPAITVPQDALEITISAEGIVFASLPNQTDLSNLGQLELAQFSNTAGLEARGRNLFIETTASGPPILGNPGQQGMGTLIQNFLENSNVQVVTEIIELIIAQRAFEANTNVIQSADEMLQIANNARR